MTPDQHRVLIDAVVESRDAAMRAALAGRDSFKNEQSMEKYLQAVEDDGAAFRRVLQLAADATEFPS